MKKQLIRQSNDQPNIPKADKPKTILVVEDDRTHRTLMEKILNDCGFKVVTAENGYVALSHLEKPDHYDLVLMDWDMPELNGIETVKEIRKREAEKNKDRIPVIAFTANRDPEHREACIAAGMDAYLPKDVWLPKWQSTLMGSIENLLAQEFDLGEIEQDSSIKAPKTYNIDSFDQEIFEKAANLLKDELGIAITEYLEDAAAYIKDIENGFETGDAAAVQRASHPLKSNSKSFGLTAVSNLAKRINEYTLGDNIEAAKPLFPELQKAFRKAEEKLHSLLKQR